MKFSKKVLQRLLSILFLCLITNAAYSEYVFDPTITNFSGCFGENRRLNYNDFGISQTSQGVSYWWVGHGSLGPGWVVRNNCTRPSSYWRRFLVNARFPTLIEKRLPISNSPKNLGGKQCANNEGNPINVANGNKYQQEVDFVSQSQGGLSFNRHYNSISSILPTVMGKGWKHDYMRSIEGLRRINQLNGVSVVRHDGSAYFFSNASGQWLPDNDITYLLEPILDGVGENIGWRLTNNSDEVEEYDVAGKLILITDRAGQTQTLEYDISSTNNGDDNSETLDKVTDHFGRTLLFSYNPEGLIQSVLDSEGKTYSYTYDDNGNLISVTYPDSNSREYLYEDISYTTYLTGIINENTDRFATWAYDSLGRAILSEHAGNQESFTFTYNADGTTTVTDLLGASRIYTFETHHGVVKTANVAGDQCAFCGQQAQDQSYDANGFLASRTDFEGNVTNFINNTRGLQESRTEAVGTAEERTITTEWHPDFRLPTKIIEPGKETEFSYDTQGRLLSRTEREI